MNQKTQQALMRLAATEDGKDFLHWLMTDECAFYAHPLCLTTQNEVSSATVIMDAKRSIWLNTRIYIPIEDRIKIEYREHFVRPETKEEPNKEDAECQTKTPKTRRQQLQERETQQLQEPVPELEHRQRRRPPSTPTGA